MTNTNYIAGYTRRGNRPWNKMLIGLGILFLAFLWFLASVPEKKIEVGKLSAHSRAPIFFTATNNPITEEALVATSEEQTPPPDSNLASLKVIYAATCRSISAQNTPVNVTSTFPAESQRIYYHTSIQANSVPVNIQHIWINPSGQRVATIPLHLTNQNANTYSFYAIAGDEIGKWKVEALDSRQQVLSSTTFVVENR